MSQNPFHRLLLACFILISQTCFPQYILNGSAKKISCNCYTLTDETMTQSGSVWNGNKINLNTSFDFWFNVYLGCKDADGADGIVFILQPISTSVGTTGEGMGFDGVRPSLGIALDTWQNVNLNDPSYDHISIQTNGAINHNNDLAGPVPISSLSDNVEDCRWHVLRIAWDAATKNLQAYFDGVLRVEKQVDMVSTIFNGDPAVYWGFTGATGGAVNLQQFCTALNPLFRTNGKDGGGCVNAPLQFRDSSESFAPVAKYNWSFGDGGTSTSPNPVHTYAAPGSYGVNLKITGQDGCEKDSTLTVTVGTVPSAGAIDVSDACVGDEVVVHFTDANVGVSYNWRLDDSLFSNVAEPRMSGVPEGVHQLDLLINSNFDCGPPANAKVNFTVKPLPKPAASTEDGCVRESLQFQAVQVDNVTSIAQWQWSFGDGDLSADQNAIHGYTAPARYLVKLWAKATNGCTSDTVFTTVGVNAATVFAGRDTAIITDLPFELHGFGNGDFLWLPASALSDPTIANPVVILSSDQAFTLKVTTAEGCTATDTVLVRVFKGPAVYVPTAFTPNGDGRNDVLRPVYVGIKELKQFAVFNRWGQLVFTTANLKQGWEGRDALPGTYVWLIKAVNSLDQPVTLKGTVTIIR